MTKEQRERLAGIRENLSAVRDRKATASKALSAARQSGDDALIATADATVETIRAEEQQLVQLENLALAQISGTSHATDRLGLLRNNVEAQQTLRELASQSLAPRHQVHIGQMMTVEEACSLTGRALEAAIPAPSGGGGSTFLGIAPTPVVPTSLLDFFQSVPMDERTATVLRRSGAADAAIQVHGSVKQEASLVYTPATLRAITIAVWTKVNKQDLDDIDALLSDVGEALSYGVRLKVEALLLNGAPSSADGAAVPGLLTDAFQPVVTATTLDGAVGQMKAQLLASGVVPNFAAANATTIEIEESRVGSDGHPIGAIDEQGRIRRVPLVSSEALDDGQVIVGDSRISAKLGVRSPISLAVSPSDQDDWVRNRATVLSEGRFTPQVKVPSAIATHTLGEAE